MSSFDKKKIGYVRQFLNWFDQLNWFMKAIVVLIGGGYLILPDLIPGPIDDAVVAIISLIIAYVGDVVIDYVSGEGEPIDAEERESSGDTD
jgi:hypothetical protein